MSEAQGGLRLGAAVRDLWLLEPECAFLNHGSFGATPIEVLEEQRRWRDRLESEPVRFMVDELPELLREAADALATFLGARGSDLVFVDNATSGVNAVLRSLDLDPGDRIVTTSHVYPAVHRTLEFICGRSDAELAVAEVPHPLTDSAEVVEAVEQAFSPSTRLLLIDHITSPTAIVYPVEELIALAHSHGVRVLVDGAHAPGMLELDLDGLGADYYTGNCHKWLFAPKGCGFLWARPEAREGLHPTVISHGFGQGFTAEFDWTGTRDPSACLAVPAALDFHRRLGGFALSARNHDLAIEAADLLASAWQGERPVPPALCGSMATVAAPGDHPATIETGEALSRTLRHQHHIEVPVIAFGGTLWVRVSAQAYNEIGDYQRLIDAAGTVFG
jgi:isopenicillin-N epimerase